MQATISQLAPTTSLQARVLRSIDELEGIRDIWSSLAGHRESDLDFFLAVLGERQETIRPHVIVVYNDSGPAAILAGRLDRTRLDRVRIGYVRVRPKAKVLHFMYGGLRGDRSLASSDLILREIWSNLSSGEADIAYLNYLSEDSALYLAATTRTCFLARDRFRRTQRHYTASLPKSAEAFRQQLSPKVRKNQRWNKMNRDFPGSVRIQCLQRPDELGELLATAEMIARRSYQRGLGVGFSNTSLERRRLQLKAEKGWLRAYFLYIGGTPAAFLIGDIDRSTFGTEYLGFDPEFSKYSPGTYLILRALEGLCEGNDGVSEVDFGTGHAEYKQAFSNIVHQETEVYIFGPGLRGLTINFIKSSAVVLDNGLKKLLARMGLLQRLKKGWRRRLASSR